MDKINFEKVAFFVFISLGLSVVIIADLLSAFDNRHFVILAQSFLYGKLSLPFSMYDASIFEGKYFWPLGPFPAILLTPFVFFSGITMRQGYVQIILIILDLLLAYLTAKRITQQKRLSAWLGFGYIFSTAYIGVAVYAWSWQFAQIVATTCLLLALYEFVGKRRWVIIGIFLGFAVMTRFNLLLSMVFFIGIILVAKQSLKEKIRSLLFLFFPVFLSLICIFLYNYYRFHNGFEQGYSFQHLTNPDLIANRAIGLWSLRHIPANLYYLFLKGPDPVLIPGTKVLTYPFLTADPWGMSILVTSPMFFWVIKTQWRKKEVQFAAITAILLLFSIVGYYGIGYAQYGYRYALDFYPFLYFMLLYSFRKLEKGEIRLAKLVIIFSACINLFFLFIHF